MSYLFLLNRGRNTSFSVSLPFEGSVTLLSCLFCSGDRSIGHSVLCAADCTICMGCLLSAREQPSWVATGQLYARSNTRYGGRSATEIACFPLWTDRAFIPVFSGFWDTNIPGIYSTKEWEAEERILQNICTVRFQMVKFLDWSKCFKVLFFHLKLVPSSKLSVTVTAWHLPYPRCFLYVSNDNYRRFRISLFVYLQLI
jgi:hypothetical protein